MAKLDKKAIETLSVNAVRDSIVISSFLDQFIADNDKEPSWDGNVYIYENSSKTKDKLKGRMPVQIKGKQTDDFSKDEIGYSMSTSDLKNYLYDGGAVLFVVYLNERLEKKIYYSELTPIKLKFLLNDAKEQKTKTVTLKTFPDDGNRKATIFLNCLQNCQKQASFSDAKLYTFEELQEKELIESLTIPFSGAGIDDPQKALLTNEMYLYANIKGSSIPQPIEILPKEMFTHQILDNEVTIDGKTFYKEYGLIKSSNSTTIKFGESFTIKMADVPSTCKIDYKNSTKMRVLAKDLDFLLSYIEKGYFEINGASFPFDYPNADFSNFDMEEAKETLVFVQRAVQVFDMMNCNDDLDLSTLTDEDVRNLNRLAIALIDKQPVRGLKEDLQPISVICVGKFKFAIALHKEENGEKGVYYLFDFFRSEFNVAYEDENGKMQPTSQYTIFTTKNLLEVSNLRPEVLLPSFQKLKKKCDFNRENWFLLNLLEAYDMSEGKRNDLLKVALDFAMWIKEKENDIDYAIKELNCLQVILRQRSLNIIEINELWNIVEDNAINDMCKVGAYLLLEQQVPAERYFNKLSKEQREEFKTFPIYHFWNQQE